MASKKKQYTVYDYEQHGWRCRGRVAAQHPVEAARRLRKRTGARRIRVESPEGGCCVIQFRDFSPSDIGGAREDFNN